MERSDHSFLIDNFLDKDTLIRSYTSEQVEEIRNILHVACSNTTDVFLTIKIISVCAGEFSTLKPVEESKRKFLSFLFDVPRKEYYSLVNNASS